MTTIAAARKGKKICIGCDSLTIFENRKEIEGKSVLGGSKILKCNNAYINFSGSAVWSQVFSAYLKKISPQQKFSDPNSIFKEMLHFHKELKEEFFLTPQQHSSDIFESSEHLILLISPHGIFEIDWTRNVREYKKFAAIGTGDEYAMGAMQAVYDSEKDPVEIVKAGIRASAKFDKKTELPIECYSISLN